VVGGKTFSFFFFSGGAGERGSPWPGSIKKRRNRREKKRENPRKTLVGEKEEEVTLSAARDAKPSHPVNYGRGKRGNEGGHQGVGDECNGTTLTRARLKGPERG